MRNKCAFFLLNQRVVPLKETTRCTPRNTLLLLKERAFSSSDA